MSTLPREYLVTHFDVEQIVGPELPPSYNVAPGATVYAIAETRLGRRLGSMRWGLVPPWASTPKDGPQPINARAETLLEKAPFADALEHRRVCILPVDGFYEWRDGPDGKQPFLLTAADGSPLAMAGLWSRWSGEGGESLVTFAIVTCEANDDVSPLHDRMPVVLTGHDWATWLNRTTDVHGRLTLMAPRPPGSLVARPVSRRVNDARNDDPELLSAGEGDS